NRRIGRKFGKRRERLKPRQRGGVDQIGQGLPPEKVSAEDDGGLVLLRDHHGIPTGMAGKIFDANGRGSDTKFDRGIVENVRYSESFDFGFLLGCDVFAEELQILGVDPGGYVAMSDDDRTFFGENRVPSHM